MDMTIVVIAALVLYFVVMVLGIGYTSPQRLPCWMNNRWNRWIAYLLGFVAYLILLIAGFEAWLGPRGGIG